jgi:hypothetical protein
MNVNLHIERLVLDGVPLAPGQQHLLHAALCAELTRLIATGGMQATLAAGAALPHLGGTALTLPANADAGEAGTSIAASIYGGMGR